MNAKFLYPFVSTATAELFFENRSYIRQWLWLDEPPRRVLQHRIVE